MEIRRILVILATLMSSCAPSHSPTQEKVVSPKPEAPISTTAPTSVPALTKELCPPEEAWWAPWKELPKEGIRPLTSEGEIEVTKSKTGGLEIVYPDKGLWHLTPANGSVIDLDDELHFGIQVWFCGERIWYLFADPYRPDTPVPPPDYSCQPAIQIADSVANELLQPNWTPWDGNRLTFELVEGAVNLSILVEDGELVFNILSSENADLTVLLNTSGYGAVLVPFYVFARDAVWGPILVYLCPEGSMYTSDEFKNRSIPVPFPEWLPPAIQA